MRRWFAGLSIIAILAVGMYVQYVKSGHQVSHLLHVEELVLAGVIAFIVVFNLISWGISRMRKRRIAHFAAKERGKPVVWESKIDSPPPDPFWK